jgi:hypothetical protein
VIVIMIGLGIVWKFNSAFRQFALSYFGQYLDCLLANGELPSIASGKPGTCDAEFKPFDLASGRSPINPSSSSSGSSGNSSSGDYGRAKDSKGSRSSSSGKSSDSPSSSSEGSGSSSGSTSSSSSSRRSSSSSSGKDDSPGGLGNDSANSSRVPAPATQASSKSAFGSGGGSNSSGDSEKEKSGSDEKKSGDDSSGSGSGNSRFGSRSDTEEGRLRYVPSGSQAKRDDREETLRPEKVPASDGDSAGSAGRVPLAKGDRKVASSEDDDDSMALPNFIRYLLIAAIVIALVLFLGGQAVQISKGQEGGSQ